MPHAINVTTLYNTIFTHPKPLPATTSLQLEPANNVFEPISQQRRSIQL